MFDVHPEGIRFTLAIPDKPEAVVRILEVIRKHNLPINSIITLASVVGGKRVVIVRLRTKECQPLVVDMEKAGFDILTVGGVR